MTKTNQVIAVELQAHGHTSDRDRPLSFEQDADDVATLLKQLQIEKADLMGFSNGGTTSLQIAIRHPDLVNKLVLASTTYKRDGMQPGFWDGMQHAALESMPKPLQDDYFGGDFARRTRRMKVGAEGIACPSGTAVCNWLPPKARGLWRTHCERKSVSTRWAYRVGV